MKKIDLGQTLQILGNFSVVVGILLLVFELNQNRDMMQSQVRNDIADTLVDILYQRANSPYLADILVKLDAGDPLSAVETRRFSSMQAAEWRYRGMVYDQYRDGLYEEAEYVAQREAWRATLNSNESIRALWCSNAVPVSPAFASEINKLLERPCE